METNAAAVSPILSTIRFEIELSTYETTYTSPIVPLLILSNRR